MLSYVSQHAYAQERCITDTKNARLIADFQTASLLCPKWKIISRVDYAYLLMEMSVLHQDDLMKSDRVGVVTLREQCQDDLYQLEKESFKMAEESGVEKFCLRTSIWLTVPNLRDALERHGFFPSSKIP
ncbi:hypothetical protein [Mesorhizobium sp.]|uniref:hypothetical protein n=1 Tax=Mesorhizobium sp. TaxID=1871066 RepID=UPI000FE70EB1|nr:hypothetical protein [Mesorhizobium sp.]RWQ59829.1 MAG: hypothetical protein EOS83_08645 [Mesorhizobium sp.]